MSRRVVVTGMGAVTPIGNSLPEFWSAVREKKIGFGSGGSIYGRDCHRKRCGKLAGDGAGV